MTVLSDAAPHVLFGLDPLWVATVILVATYAAVITERVNRAVVAILGAVLMIALGVLTQEEAVQGVDFNTIALLLGMMVIVGVARRSGVFEYLAIRSAKVTGGHPAAVLAVLALATAVLSAFLDNVTTVLLVAPVTIALTKDLRVDPYPYLFAEVFASNLGGTATLVGDPPNILIGSSAHLTYWDFVANLAPLVIVLLVGQALAIHFIWGKRLTAAPEDRRRVMAMDARAAIKDVPLLRRSVGVLAGVTLAFVAAPLLRLEPGSIALGGAAVLLLLDTWGQKPVAQARHIQAHFADAQWITLLFFVGLFIVVAGVERAGLLDHLARALVAATGGSLAATAGAVLWVSAIVSAVIDNIPFVATMVPVVHGLAPVFGGPEAIQPIWWALSLGACLGGNGTLIGASANLTVAGFAEQEGVPFRFWRFTKFAFPLMLLTVAIAHVYLWLRYL